MQGRRGLKLERLEKKEEKEKEGALAEAALYVAQEEEEIPLAVRSQRN